MLYSSGLGIIQKISQSSTGSWMVAVEQARESTMRLCHACMSGRDVLSRERKSPHGVWSNVHCTQITQHTGHSFTSSWFNRKILSKKKKFSMRYFYIHVSFTKKAIRQFTRFFWKHMWAGWYDDDDKILCYMTWLFWFLHLHHFLFWRRKCFNTSG